MNHSSRAQAAPQAVPQVVIVGGGYAGAATALHLAKYAHQSIDIHVIEPRPALGAGLAYSANDPDHRINGPHRILMIEAGDLYRFANWTKAQGIDESDTDGWARPSELYVRRQVFGKFMAEQMASAIGSNESGSAIIHHRTSAIGAERQGTRSIVRTVDGQALPADLVIVTTGNQLPARPAGLAEALDDDPRYVPNPWDLERLGAIDPQGRVMILGTGLTMADVVISLLRLGHKGEIVAVSRRGLLPQPQADGRDIDTLLSRKSTDDSAFIAKHGQLTTVRSIVRAVRADIAERAAAGLPWHLAFDGMRDGGGALWRGLPAAERRRYMRHLKPWFETRRYRLAPQIEARLRAAIAEGQVKVMAGRTAAIGLGGSRLAVALKPRGGQFTGEAFDAVINCTGPDGRPSLSGSAFLKSITEAGLGTDDPDGMGLWVDRGARMRTADGQAQDDWRALGTLSRGWYGDLTSVRQISMQLAEVIPELLTQLEIASKAEAPALAP
ncbi:MAG: FAD/NAD(P)-binding protein [Alphaproteobacteria bacterium]